MRRTEKQTIRRLYLKTIFFDRRTGVGDAEERVKGSAGDVRAVHGAGEFARLDSDPRRRDGPAARAPANRQRDRNPRGRYHGCGIGLTGSLGRKSSEIARPDR